MFHSCLDNILESTAPAVEVIRFAVFFFELWPALGVLDEGTALCSIFDIVESCRFILRLSSWPVLMECGIGLIGPGVNGPPYAEDPKAASNAWNGNCYIKLFQIFILNNVFLIIFCQVSNTEGGDGLANIYSGFCWVTPKAGVKGLVFTCSVCMVKAGT